MDVAEAIRTRRSVGRLEGMPEPETIRELIEMAVWAPNHRLTEPWHFTIVAGAARTKLAAFWGEVVADDCGANGADRTTIGERESKKLDRAPVLIVVSSRTDSDTIVATEDHAATAAAIQNLLLAAHARGLGTVWRTGAIAYHPRIKSYLGLQPSDAILGIVYLGSPATAIPPARARNLDAAMSWI